MSPEQEQTVHVNVFYCTDVDEVSLPVQHDVAVVSVFYLKQEKQKAVGGHAADEVIPSLWGGEEKNKKILIDSWQIFKD